MRARLLKTEPGHTISHRQSASQHGRQVRPLRWHAQGLTAIAVATAAMLLSDNAQAAAADDLGLQASGPAADIRSENKTISTQSDYAQGAKAELGGHITAENIHIQTQGAQALGVVAAGVGSQITVTGNSSIDTQGFHAFGAQALTGAQITLNGTRIDTYGETTSGVLSGDTGSHIRVENASITSHGARSEAISAYGSGTVTVVSSEIVTLGESAWGMSVSNTNAWIDAEKVKVTTTGVNSTGAFAEGEGALRIRDSTITVAQASGLVVTGNATADLSNLQIQTSGDGAAALQNLDGGTITGEGVQATATGANAHALALSGPNNKATATLTGSTLSSEAGTAIASTEGNTHLDLTQSSASSGTGALLQVGREDAGVVLASTLTLKADASTLTGTATTLAGSTAAVALTNGSVWRVTGNSNVTHLSNTASTVALGGDSGFTTLTVDGNYTGGAGSTVSLNTVLGDDQSATDKLVVKGDTAGQSTLKVTNSGGAGALTTQGIQVVNVAGASDAVFNLQGDYVQNGEQAVVGGAYAYKLYQGSASDPADGNWYLRSQVDPDLKPNPGPEPAPAPAPQPLYQAGVPSYEAYPQALLALNGLNTLHQRVGNRAWRGDDSGIEGNGVWLRIDGGRNHMEPKHSTSDTNFNQNIYTIQAGRDAQLKTTESGALVGGLNLRYTHGKTKTKSVHGDGEINTNGYGVGATATWYDNRGFYVDGQGQLTWYRSDLQSKLINRDLEKKNHGFGYALSIEGGKNYALNSTGLALTPQAQLTYSHVDFDSFNDTFGARVSMDKGQSLQGRLGLMLGNEKNGKDANGVPTRTHAYGIANLYYEFMGKTKVTVANTAFESRNDRLWGGLGIGGTHNFGVQDRYSVYGEALLKTSLQNFGDSHAAKIHLGFRAKW